MRKEVSTVLKTAPEMPVIHIGDQLRSAIPSLCDMRSYTRAVIITDTRIPEDVVRAVKSSLPVPATIMTVPSGEESKSVNMLTEIWKHMAHAGCDRGSVVINVGGGVVCDLGGFAAATYMRGVDWINVPTTLLSQVDAAVGGKTGIDFDGAKNLIGIIRQPKAVIIDVGTLSTLPRREFISGFAEVIKHGLIHDAAYFARVTAKKPEVFTEPELIDIVSRSVRIKSAIVQKDPTETGGRKILNFGHTIGHAVEALSQLTDRPLLHGEAVAIGMATETTIAHMAGLLSMGEKEQIIQSLRHAGLPTRLPAISRTVLKAQMLTDKKNINGEIRWVLPVAIGKAIYDARVDSEIVDAVLQKGQNV